MQKKKPSQSEAKINLKILEGVEHVEPLYWENWNILIPKQKKYYVANICSFFGDALIEEIYQNVDNINIDQTFLNPKPFIRDFYKLPESIIEEIFFIHKNLKGE